jgi:hypothetical protein
LEFGKILGEIIGIARMDLESDLRKEADELVKEGRKISETAGDGASRGDFEKFQMKCKNFLLKLEEDEKAPGIQSSTDV